MRAVRHTLTQGRVPQEAPLLLVVDNTSVMYSIARQRSRRFQMNAELQKILPNWPNVKGVRYIRSADNPADGLSRGAKLLDQQLLVEALTALDLAVGSKETQPGQRIKVINCPAIPASESQIDPRDLL
jgi:hypothetical protein